MGEHSELRWRRSSRCGGEANCVEVAFVGDRVLVRDGPAAHGTVASFTRGEWADFVAAVKDHEFDD